jgi:hypothetical protein
MCRRRFSGKQRTIEAYVLRKVDDHELVRLDYMSVCMYVCMYVCMHVCMLILTACVCMCYVYMVI